MPESPVRKKVVNKYWEDDEAAFMVHLQRHLIKKDTEFDDPTTVAPPRQHNLWKKRMSQTNASGKGKTTQFNCCDGLVLSVLHEWETS